MADNDDGEALDEFILRVTGMPAAMLGPAEKARWCRMFNIYNEAEERIRSDVNPATPCSTWRTDLRAAPALHGRGRSSPRAREG
jgi:hypothetical protein